MRAFTIFVLLLPLSIYGESSFNNDTTIDFWSYTTNLIKTKSTFSLNAYLDEIEEKTYKTDPELIETITEGTLSHIYHLDLIAENATYGSIDFSKALRYNQKTNRLLEQHIELLTKHSQKFQLLYPSQSEYYFYDDYYVNDEEKVISEHLGPSDYIKTARVYDLIKIKNRIRDRKAFIEVKTGKQLAQQIQTRKKKISDTKKQIYYNTLSNDSSLGTYEKNYALAEMLWNFHQEGIEIDFSNLKKHAILAIEHFPKQKTHLIDQKTRLFLWAGFSGVKNADQDAYRYLRAFFLSARQVDESRIKQAAARREIIGLAYNKKSKIGGIIGDTLIAATMGFGFYAQFVAPVQAVTTASTIPGLVAAENMTTQIQVMAAVSNITGATFTGLVEKLKYDISSNDKPSKLEELPEEILHVSRYLNRIEQMELFNILGAQYASIGKTEAAITYLKNALKIAEIQRGTISDEEDRIRFMQLRDASTHRLIKLLLQTGNADEAFLFSEKSRARVFLDLLDGEQELNLKTESQTLVYSTEKMLTQETAELLDQNDVGIEQLIDAGTQHRGIGGVISTVKTLQQDFALIGQSDPISISEVVNKLDRGTAVISYYILDDQLVKFLIDDSGLSVYSTEISPHELHSHVMEWRSKLMNPDIDFRSFATHSPLSKHLLSGLDSFLADKKELIIIPHQILHLIPFQTLVFKDEYLVDKFPIINEPSVSIFGVLQDHITEKEKNPILFGNPYLDYVEGEHELKYAEQETNDIAQLYPGSKKLLHSEASESNFKTYSNDFNIIHIAAHGSFNKQNPLYSSLYLSSDDENDGQLHSIELYEKELNASLVVLSACESGIPEITSSDELNGFTRAFLYAGADATITSLWQVSDITTSQLMTDFYRLLRNEHEISPFEALTISQRNLKKAYPHPYYWAPFIVVGQKGC